MKQTPLVSIIILTYNRIYLIDKILDAVITKAYKNWECLVSVLEKLKFSELNDN